MLISSPSVLTIGSESLEVLMTFASVDTETCWLVDTGASISVVKPNVFNNEIGDIEVTAK
jgi:hypothetical protein